MLYAYALRLTMSVGAFEMKAFDLIGWPNDRFLGQSNEIFERRKKYKSWLFVEASETSCR